MEQGSELVRREKRVSWSVKIFAWASIICNFSLLTHLLRVRTGFFEFSNGAQRNFVQFMILNTDLSAMAGILIGLGILRVKERVRKVGLVIYSLTLFIVYPIFIIILGDFKKYYYKVAVFEQANKLTALGIDALANANFHILVFLVGLNAILSLLFIYVFTRPQVKRQFKTLYVRTVRYK